MKRNIIYAFALFLSFQLTSCNTGDERYQNEMQEESTEPNMRREADSRGVEPSTPLSTVGGEEGRAQIGDLEMTPTQNLVENLASDAKLTTLSSVIKKADFVKVLNATGPHTVFAPANEAFEKLPENTLEDLMKPGNRTQLTALLKNHVVAGELKANQLQDGSTLTTLGGTQLKVIKQGDRVTINGAEVSQADAMSENGVIHVINKVITSNE
ncbi:fasciclin domain-containing protein [Pontibacter sp. CAU 1760]